MIKKKSKGIIFCISSLMFIGINMGCANKSITFLHNGDYDRVEVVLGIGNSFSKMGELEKNDVDNILTSSCQTAKKKKLVFVSCSQYIDFYKDKDRLARWGLFHNDDDLFVDISRNDASIVPLTACHLCILFPKECQNKIEELINKACNRKTQSEGK